MARGKWARGITPRNFHWIIKERLAVCERPGGCGDRHRRVRRQEEAIWIREQGFDPLVSLLGSNHNLASYEELGLPYLHRPFAAEPDRITAAALGDLYAELRELLASGHKVIVHRDEVGDALVGVMGGYLLWSGLVPSTPGAVSIAEELTGRPLGPGGRQLIAVAESLETAGE